MRWNRFWVSPTGEVGCLERDAQRRGDPRDKILKP